MLNYSVDEWILKYVTDKINKYGLRSTINRCNKLGYFFINYTKESIINKIKTDNMLCLKVFLSYVKINELVDICKQCHIKISGYSTKNKFRLIKRMIKN
jgi:hypothetical protein